MSAYVMQLMRKLGKVAARLNPYYAQQLLGKTAPGDATADTVAGLKLFRHNVASAVAESPDTMVTWLVRATSASLCRNLLV